MAMNTVQKNLVQDVQIMLRLEGELETAKNELVSAQNIEKSAKTKLEKMTQRVEGFVNKERPTATVSIGKGKILTVTRVEEHSQGGPIVRVDIVITEMLQTNDATDEIESDVAVAAEAIAATK